MSDRLANQIEAFPIGYKGYKNLLKHAGLNNLKLIWAAH